MNNYIILRRLYNDIVSSLYNDAYIVNQENEINKLNTHKVKGWHHCLDAYSINQRTENYQGNYLVDKKKISPFNISHLSFESYSNTSGRDLLNFINKILSGDPKVFVHVDNLLIYDLRKKLFEIKKIEIKDTTVDNILLINIYKYFHNLEEIKFTNCIIKKECDFSKLKASIEFNESKIESIRVFNDTKANLIFRRSKIEKIVNTSILSNSIEFLSFNDYIFKDLFLKCNFHNLENLTIYRDKEFVQHSYQNQFIFLPRSAPNLENLYINGKLSSFDFLYDMRNLLRCNIDSIYDYLSVFYPDVDSKKEREKLKRRNLYDYEVAKMIKGYEDKFIIGTIELDKIIRMARVSKLLSYHEDELKDLLKNRKLSLPDIKDGEITKFYESYFDTLIMRNTLNEKDVRLGLEETYFNIKNLIYRSTVIRRLNNSKEIVKGANHIYRCDSTPIIFMNRKKNIRTRKDALKFTEKYGYKTPYDEKQMYKDEYNHFLDIIASLKEEVQIGELIDYLGEVVHFKIKKEHFVNLGEGGRYIAGTLEKVNRIDKSYNDIASKNRIFLNKLLTLINDNYDKFTVLEKLYMYNQLNEYDGNKLLVGRINDIYDLKILYDSSVINSINDKTNNLYYKYISILKMTYLQISNHENGYRIPVKEEYIKKLSIKKM